MKRQVNELWKEKYGNKTIWRVQAPKGILTFRTKEQAMKWVEASKESK